MFSKPACTLLATALIGCTAAMAADRPPVTDPTAPPHKAAIRSAAGAVHSRDEVLLLHSTHVSPSTRSAVINNQVVVIGSRIDGAVVTAIEQGRVTLDRNSESIVLRLILPPVKRPAKDAG
ncbi:MAG: hypothetical protein WD795_20925 [Woeseia sp.]